LTLAAIEIPIEESSRFGVLSVDEQDKITGFIEKSKNAPAIPGSPDLALGSMGIYVFDTDVLLKALEADAARPSSHDFGKDIIPVMLTERPTYAYRFYDENKKASKYWRDIGTLDAFFDANMDLCGVDPEFNLYDPEWPMRTYQPQAPPAKFVFAERNRRCGEALDSVISPGCIISGSRVVGSVLCPNVRVHSYGVIEQCILMPGVRVGRHARIRRAIIDRDVLIPRGAVIGFNHEEDRKRHTVTDLGVVVVTEDDDPLVEPISEEALGIEAEDDGR
jgi:glucose-1-phosphate adenylyltransferase